MSSGPGPGAPRPARRNEATPAPLHREARASGRTPRARPRSRKFASKRQTRKHQSIDPRQLPPTPWPCALARAPVRTPRKNACRIPAISGSNISCMNPQPGSPASAEKKGTPRHGPARSKPERHIGRNGLTPTVVKEVETRPFVMGLADQSWRVRSRPRHDPALLRGDSRQTGLRIRRRRRQDRGLLPRNAGRALSTGGVRPGIRPFGFPTSLTLFRPRGNPPAAGRRRPAGARRNTSASGRVRPKRSGAAEIRSRCC